MWWNGNDFQTWRNASDDAAVLAVARGIRSEDRAHIQTVQLDYFKSASLDDRRWKPVIGLDAAYTYYATYAEVLKEYEQKDFMPVFLSEAGYESEQNSPSISPGNPGVLRRQEYWSVLSGAAGQFYGNHYTWQFTDGWKQQPRHARERAGRVSREAVREPAMVPARAGSRAQDRHGRFWHVRVVRQRRIEQLRDHGRDA